MADEVNDLKTRNQKRLRQSPENNNITKVIKTIQSSVPLERFTNPKMSDTETVQELDANGKLLLKSFHKVLVMELDSRFDSFCKNEFFPLKQDVIEVKKELIDLKTEVAELKIANENLTAKLDKSESQISQLERESRSHNLIFYNVTQTSNLQQAVIDICKSILKVQEEIKISRAIVLKRNAAAKTFTILIKFESTSIVSIILAGAKHLRDSGTGISISRDLSEGERKIKNILLEIKRKIQERDTYSKVKVVGTKIYIDNVTLTYNEKNKTFGNSQIDGTAFLQEKFSIDLNNLMSNNK